eukprot:1713574-Amphidinium_carterae.1
MKKVKDTLNPADMLGKAVAFETLQRLRPILRLTGAQGVDHFSSRDATVYLQIQPNMVMTGMMLAVVG